MKEKKKASVRPKVKVTTDLKINAIKIKLYQFSYYCKTFQVQSIKHAILTSDTIANTILYLYK